VVLFVVTELPQGGLALCSGLVEHCFHSYYAPLGDTMDIVALVNNGINFALYCTMSARFRQTFARLVSPSTPLVGGPGLRLRRRRRRWAADDPGADGCTQEDGEVSGCPVSDARGEEATWNITSETRPYKQTGNDSDGQKISAV